MKSNGVDHARLLPQQLPPLVGEPPPMPKLPPLREQPLALRILGDIQRLQIGPGDTIVLTLDQPITYEAAVRLKQELHDVFGVDAKILILTGGMHLGVVGR